MDACRGCKARIAAETDMDEIPTTRAFTPRRFSGPTYDPDAKVHVQDHHDAYARSTGACGIQIAGEYTVEVSDTTPITCPTCAAANTGTGTHTVEP
jgi:hypothetical protein